MARSEIRYAPTTDGIDIAYQVVGEGPVDLVVVSGFITHLDLVWDLPHLAWLERFEGLARVIIFDKRGTGLSDRSLGFGSLDERASDIGAVMDAAGSAHAHLLGISEGGPMSILFAASFPERVDGLFLYGTAARFGAGDDYPFGLQPSEVERFLAFIESRWGTGKVFTEFLQGAPDRDAVRELIGRFERSACTPKMAAEIMRRNLEIDVRSMLPAVTSRTMVVHAVGDPIVPIDSARYLAAHIAGAELLELPGAFHGSWDPNDVAEWVDAVGRFLDVGGAPQLADRVLATVMFTDIVSSTERARAVGDESWRTLLDQHDRRARFEIERAGGRLVKTTGDGVLATFESPGRAIRCARSIARGVRPLGLEIRAGVHTGEIERRGDDIAGMGVVIASRVAALAAGGQVLVSQTVKDLVTGSGIELREAGSHELKGVPDTWRLFEAG